MTDNLRMNPEADTELDELLLSAKQMTEVLHVSRSTLYQWDQEGRIPAPIRIGNRIYWRSDETRRWVEANCPPRVKWEAPCHRN